MHTQSSKADWPARGFRCGVPPWANGAFAEHQGYISEVFRAQTALWNRLVEAETAYRGASDAALRAEIERRGLDLSDPEHRRQARRAIRDELDELEAVRRSAVKAADRDSGLWWAHRVPILDRYGIMRVKAMREGAHLHPAKEPEERGVLAVAWPNRPGGVPIPRIFAGEDPMAGLVYDAPRPAIKSTGRVRATLNLRIASPRGGERRLEIPVVFGERIPAADVAVSVVLYAEGTHDGPRWRGAITVREPPGPPPVPPRGPELLLRQRDIGVTPLFEVEWEYARELVGALGPDERRYDPYREAAGLRRRALRRRKHEYQRRAKALARKHRRIVAEPLQRRLGSGRAAYGEFLRYLRLACAKTGCELVFREPAECEAPSEQPLAGD